MTRAALLAEGEAALRQADVPDARLDAEYLLAFTLGLERLPLLLSLACECELHAAQAFRALIARRAAREPLGYIIGTQCFMGYEFCVTPDVLIPRADTETLCERALHWLGADACALDLCTGSGAIGISLKREKPDARVYAGDLSEAALRVARQNAERLNARVEFRLGDLFTPFHGLLFDVIACNPPYIPMGEIPDLQPEVRFEPHMALDGGADGLAFYRRLAREARLYLREGGTLLMETGDGQSDAVRVLLTDAGCYEDVQIHRDLSGLPRVAEARLRKGC